jgi:hypothetical protein
MEPSEDQLLSEVVIAIVHWAYLYDPGLNLAEQHEIRTLYTQIPELIAQETPFSTREIELMTKAVVDFSHL